MTGSVQDMTPRERLRAAAIILRDVAEQQDYEEALREHESRTAAMAS